MRAGHSDEEIDKDMALAYMGLRHAGSAGHNGPDSSDPTWLDRESPPPTVAVINADEEEDIVVHQVPSARRSPYVRMSDCMGMPAPVNRAWMLNLDADDSKHLQGKVLLYCPGVNTVTHAIQSLSTIF